MWISRKILMGCKQDLQKTGGLFQVYAYAIQEVIETGYSCNFKYPAVGGNTITLQASKSQE